MRTFLKAAAIVAMIALPAAAFAQTAPATKSASKAAPAAQKTEKAAKASTATHSTSGVVKTTDDSSLVITKGGKDETFVVNSATQKQGALAVGAHVSVHYTVEGSTKTATAIAVSNKAAKSSKGKK